MRAVTLNDDTVGTLQPFHANKSPLFSSAIQMMAEAFISIGGRDE